ncbi:hypothetical protein CANARDRAFT_200983 [[Candida] arabinofermentans NRRL YB-2248]|uniref:Sm domain-containing protein n=1 Tax=[Candida] arabinofermentans NRRL YB-2248 TaxID=983967 RepID=A0A1E4SXS1_9ASCO|nr:hypothetical protein CANARDRAFT_200983 [[Candida] arabinofermentans NRRL YB-2248]
MSSSSLSSSADVLHPIDLISLPYKLHITDGRILSGILISIDDQSNLLVSNVLETNGDITRELGLVSVPKSTISKIYVDDNEWNKNIRYRVKKQSNE